MKILSDTQIAVNEGSAEKNKKMLLKPTLKLVKYSKKYLPMMGIAVTMACIASFMMIWGATKVSDVVDLIRDSIVGEASLSEIKRITCKILIIYAVYLVLASAQGILLSSLKQKLICQLRNDIEKKRQVLSMAKLSSLDTGNILSIITNDVSKLSQSFSSIVVELIPAIVLLLGTFIMMLIKNVVLTLSVIASAVIGFIFLALVMSKSQKYFVKQQETLGKINDHVEESFSGMIVVKTFNGKQMDRERFDELNEEMRKVNFKTFCFNALMIPITTLVNNLGYISICVVGAMLIAKGKISYGLIASFMLYLSSFQDPISKIGSSTEQVQNVLATSDRIFEFLEIEEMPSEADKTTKLDNIEGNVEFKNVQFGYEPEKRMIIKDFSLDVKSGQKVAIVGQTGAGKTTLINLLLRFYEINSGSIMIDGIPVSEVSREELRNQFAIVPQDTLIFNGTIRENLVLSTQNVSDERLDEVCQAVGISHLISMMPDGYDSIINENSGLSQGQKQQISIARAMIADKKMLILDEATSSVDVILEQKIQQSMDELSVGRTSFIIAHRLSTIVNADVIIVMKDGNVVESGTHDELLRRGKVYAEMYYSQWKEQ